jgi:hypothetical protein
VSIRTVCARFLFALIVVGAIVMMPALAQAQDARAAADAPVSASAGRRLLLPLYVSYGILQALDVHSTTRAIERGGVEGNPMMAGVAGQPLAMSVLKAGGAAATIVLAERLRKRSRVGAVLLMAGVNSVYGMVVAHNYRMAH